MVYKLKVDSIDDLNRKLRMILIFVMLLIIILTLAISILALRSYKDIDSRLALNNLHMQFAKFTDNYEHRIISIASQPIFRNLLGADKEIINSLEKNNPFFYSLKRQIASFTATYLNQTFFEGSTVYNSNHVPVFTQGLTISPYKITVDLCYRDAILSYNKGIPCIGSWTFYISESKLDNILSDKFVINYISGIALKDVFKFENLKLIDKSLPKSIYFSLSKTFGVFFYYIFAIIILIFIGMLALILFIIKIYHKIYFDPLYKIHQDLCAGMAIDCEAYINTPREIRNFVEAINHALKLKRLKAIENLAHDLKPPLTQIKKLASRIDNPARSQLLNLHMQMALAIHKMHKEDIENLDLKKVVYDCVNAFYSDHFSEAIISFSWGGPDLFVRAAYSHLIRVISNLIGNALVACADVIHPKINIYAYSKNNKVFLEIHDNGCGINPEQSKIIFQEGISFLGSSGKGLAYCQNIIENWLGKIYCNSLPGEDTVFTIELPRANAPFDFIDTIFLTRQTRLIIIDDEQDFHARIRACCPDNIVIKSIISVDDWRSYYVSDYSDSDRFIVDYQFSDNLHGLDIILQGRLLDKAWLISSVADFIRQNQTDIRNRLPVISKNQLNDLKFEFVEDYQCILIDDDPEILQDAYEVASMADKKLLGLNNFLQLNMILLLIDKMTPLTLDNNIENSPFNGIEIAEKLSTLGYRNIAIQSGDEINNLNSAIKILEKGEFLCESA